MDRIKKAYERAYRASPKEKATRKARRAMPKRRAARKAYDATPERRAYQKAYNAAAYRRKSEGDGSTNEKAAALPQYGRNVHTYEF